VLLKPRDSESQQPGHAVLCAPWPRRVPIRPESREHLKAKFVIAESARAAGWDASAEEPGCDPGSNPWIADMLFTRGKAKLAFEVQLSPESPDEYQARQSRYQRS